TKKKKDLKHCQQIGSMIYHLTKSTETKEGNVCVMEMGGGKASLGTVVYYLTKQQLIVIDISTFRHKLNRVRCIAIALCYRGKCSFDTYCGLEYLKEELRWQDFSRQDFGHIRQMSTWCIDGKLTENAPDSSAASRRLEIGQLYRSIIDNERVWLLKKHGFTNFQLIEFVGSSLLRSLTILYELNLCFCAIFLLPTSILFFLIFCYFYLFANEWQTIASTCHFPFQPFDKINDIFHMDNILKFKTKFVSCIATTHLIFDKNIFFITTPNYS
ncbi:hypothetical protein RFI_31247, partial [Reticulomyxa filosa]